MQAIGLNRGLLALLMALLLTACGFHLRGAGEVIPFENIYVKGDGAPTIARNLKRMLNSSGVKVQSNEEEAQVSLELMSESYTKNILSLSGGGKVREYELLYKVTFRAREAKAELWGEPQTVNLRRDFSYSDSALLAKEAEEAQLNTDMQREAVREVMRRVGSLGRKKVDATQ
jgi:LPS-assembly lipoprotein